MKPATIIPAAGFSSRMGSDKALLELGGQTTVEQIISSHRAAGTDRIIVVTGQNHAAVAQLRLQADLVRNPAPEQGMFSSIQAGAALLGPELDAFFVHPVDIPWVSPVTLSALVAALQQNPDADGVIPAYCGKRGHPPLLRMARRQELLHADGIGGLRSLFHGWRILEQASGDQAVLLNMNTPEQYARIQQCISGQITTRTRC